MPDLSSITLPDNNTYNFKDSVARVSIPYAQVDSSSTSTAFTATVDGITSLFDGVCVTLKNGIVASATDFTVNINSLGAKPVYSSEGSATRETTIFDVGSTLLLIYDSTKVDGGCWVDYHGAGYLPLTGGTLTGDLVVDDSILEMQSGSSGSGGSILFNYLGNQVGNVLGAYFQTSAYNNNGIQTKKITQAGLAAFRVPIIKNNVLTSSKFLWMQRSFNSSLDAVNYFEVYSLPETTLSLSANKQYDILTSKNAVNIAQGGTGAATAADALTNLGAASADTVPTQAGIDSSGLITFKNSSNTALFTLQLPLYNGGVS